MENQTYKKRTLVVIIWGVLIISLGLLIYYIITPAATCRDGKQNQNEKAVDCGGPCSPCNTITETQELLIKETAFADGGNRTYDVLARINNPNDAEGASSFKYIFTLKDSGGNVLATKEGTSFILPADSKYIVELGLATTEGAVPANAEVVISNITWANLGDLDKPQIGIYSKKLDKSAMGVGSEAQGVIQNESSYDLVSIGIIVVLRDDGGRVIGINKTNKNYVRVNEKRDFKIFWPYALRGSVSKMEVDAESNVFDRQNLTVVN